MRCGVELHSIYPSSLIPHPLSLSSCLSTGTPQRRNSRPPSYIPAIKDAAPIFSNLRQTKSQREIDILQHAVDITAEAFQRSDDLAEARSLIAGLSLPAAA